MPGITFKLEEELDIEVPRLSQVEPGDVVAGVDGRWRLFIGPVTSYGMIFRITDDGKFILQGTQNRNRTIWFNVLPTLTTNEYSTVGNPRRSRFKPAKVVGSIDLEDPQCETAIRSVDSMVMGYPPFVFYGAKIAQNPIRVSLVDLDPSFLGFARFFVLSYDGREVIWANIPALEDGFMTFEFPGTEVIRQAMIDESVIELVPTPAPEGYPSIQEFVRNRWPEVKVSSIHLS